jgi:LPXTG-motif cell wall-anchored protein
MSNQVRPEVGAVKLPNKGDTGMDMTTLLIIVVVVLLLGGGGFYGRGRWY